MYWITNSTTLVIIKYVLKLEPWKIVHNIFTIRVSPNTLINSGINYLEAWIAFCIERFEYKFNWVYYYLSHCFSYIIICFWWKYKKLNFIIPIKITLQYFYCWELYKEIIIVTTFAFVQFYFHRACSLKLAELKKKHKSKKEKLELTGLPMRQPSIKRNVKQRRTKYVF